MIDFSEKTSFGYAVSRVRALETRLIDRATMLRLLEEPLPGVCRLLEEKGYPPAGDYCGSIPESGDEAFISPAFADLKDTLLAETFKELKELGNNSAVTKLLPLRYDCLNLGWIMKARATQTPVPRLFNCGTVKPEALVQMIEQDGQNLEGCLKYVYQEVSELVLEESSPRLIGAKAGACYWRHFINVARREKLPFLKELAVLHIDGINLSTFAQLKQSKGAQLSTLLEELVPVPLKLDDPQPNLWEPANLDPYKASWFRKLWGEPIESLTLSLSGTRYESVANAATSTGEGFNALAFDRALDNLIGKHIREARTCTFGIEPVLAFGIAREIEITNLKILIGGRAVGLDRDTIMEELRSSYV
jgi:V/A-type H+-transporting ATPase subunit C